MILLTGALALALALVHVNGGRIHALEAMPRSRWLSGAGGVSVAYVFVHVLPELAAAQADLAGSTGGALAFLEHRAYLVALSGLALFYGLEHLARRSRARHADGGDDRTSAEVFLVHMAAFAAYNLLIGYLLVHRERSGVGGLLFFSLAIATHLLVIDVGMRDHHAERYAAWGRWLLAGAVLAGWGIGVAIRIDAGVVALLFALLAGGIVLNVLKEELPAERDSHFGAFALGAVVYTALLLVV